MAEGRSRMRTAGAGEGRITCELGYDPAARQSNTRVRENLPFMPFLSHRATSPDSPGLSTRRTARKEAQSNAKTALALLIAADSSQEVDLTKDRPIDIGEIEFTMSALPKHKS
jgi:hypothetical protein